MIKRIDHFVITTEHISDCLKFYEALGFTTINEGGRYALLANNFKINVHIKNHELEPKALHVQTGSADFCIEVQAPLEYVQKMLLETGILPITGIVTRTGVFGIMHSLYIRDPDGNLVELCNYTV